MKMRKIVAIVAAALMLFSILPISAMAAGEETITLAGSTGVLDGTASISWKGATYQVVNYKDNSGTAIRTQDTDHFRLYVGNEFHVTGQNGEAMSQVVIACTGSKYLINNTSNTVNAGWTVTANGNTITYTATSGAATELHISIGKQSRVKSVVITPGAAAGADCDHDSLDCGDTCPECEEFVKEHKFSNNCVAECENGCGEANPNYADHVYDGDYDIACNVCTATRDVTFPEADSELTIPEANEIGLGMSHDTTTASKYYVTGVVESIANTTYGNLYIQDDEGNKLYIYGTYDATGANRFDAMTEKPEVGMTITVYGVIGNYSNAAQMKNGWITEMLGGCEHDYDYECSKECYLCGIETRPEAACETDADYDCQDGYCIYCGEEVAGLGHTFDDQWDPDCNSDCGYTREVEERPEITEATITFDADKTQRTEYDSDHQVWANDNLVLTNNKAASTTPVGDYSGRFYKSSDVIIAYSGMTSLVINATGIESKHQWTDTLNNAGVTYTVEDNVYTITFAEPTNSITLAAANQLRANSITAIAVKASEPKCEHEYDNACDVDCNLCYETREVSHNVIHVVAAAPTCTAMGNIEYWYCDVCGMAWLDEACTMNTNMMAVKLPMAEHKYSGDCDITCNKCEEITRDALAEHTYNGCNDYCSVCYEGIREVTHNIIHVEAAAATCGNDGNIEYWYCDSCGAAWLDAECHLNTNLRAVKLPATGEHVYFDDCSPICDVCGYEREVSHNVIHVEAVAPTCTAMGNLEYWYCDVCGAAWLDAECIMNTNLMAVKLPAAHTFTNDNDAMCNVEGCGEFRNIETVELTIFTFQGNSVSEYTEEIGYGLAFRFEMNLSGIAVNAGTNIANYDNATINGDKVIGVGAYVSNGNDTQKVPAVYLCDFGDANGAANDMAIFAVRVINIPSTCLEREITAWAYYELEGGIIIENSAAEVNTYNNAIPKTE